MDNLQTYQSKDVVEHYTRQSELFAPERTIRDRLRDRLAAWRMLDLGVGTGRTTEHFAPLARDYLGIDYADAMVAACRETYPQYMFETADVRAMPTLADATFDFVLFSFNGIDYIEHEDRLRAWAEIRRVLAPGGTLAFSTHNLNSAVNFGHIRWTTDPKKLIRRLWRRWRLRRINGPVEPILARDHAQLNDGTFGGRLSTYYIKPSAQVRQLAEAGFGEPVVFSLATGEEIAAGASTEPWLYYLCKKG